MHHKPLFVLVVTGLILTLALAACGKPAPTAAPTSEATSAPAVTEKPANGAIDNVKDAEKAVIRIVAEGTYSYPDFTNYTEMGSGSGFIIDPSGIAVTNNHVVTGAARIKVYFSDSDKAYNARVLGVSECSDLAVIDIEGDGYPYLDWYSETPELGLTVYSLGYPLGDPNFTRHKGEISKEKTSGNTSWTAVTEVLEHDAIINPGNSGGPLVTDDAKVVGVNYAGASQYDMYFSIPASEAKPVVEDLGKGTNVDSLGINGEALVADDGSFSGIWVYSVDSGSAADKSGVKAGDFITSLEGIQLGRDGTVTDYCDVIRSHTASDTLNISLIRFGTGEIMEGQINGREMKATGSIDASGSTGSSSGGTSGTSSGSTTGSTSDTAPAYFTEEFDGDLPNWSSFFFGDNDNDFNIATENSQMVIDITQPQTYVYVNYDPYTYTDVRVDAEAENMGNNDNNISLYCRLQDKVGWYEFNISSGGLWDILRYDEQTSKYVALYNGGSYNINIGKGKPNTFSLICQGNTISAYINDKLVRSVTDYNLSEGTVGVSASSFDSGSAIVGFNWVTISEP
jgi:S1-C subfamily serine protease